MELDAARATVRAEQVRDALDGLMEIAAPMRVHVALEDQRMALTTHGPGPWWATVTVPAEVGAPGASAAASVPRLELRQAVDAEALLVPEATCSVTIVTDDVVRYGAFALAAVEPEPLRPRPDGPSTRLDTWRLAGGRGTLPDGRSITVPTSSLDRFVAREIGAVDVVDDPGGPYVVGRTGPIEGPDGGPAVGVLLVATAAWA